MENEEIKVTEENKTEEAQETVENKPAPKQPAPEESKEQPAPKKGVVGPDLVVIEKLTGEEKPLKEDVEDRRLDLYAAYTKTRRTSNWMMGGVVLVVIGAMALLLVNKDWSKIVGYSFAGVALLGLVIFSLITKNKFPAKSREYIRFITTRIDREIFSNSEFQDVKVDLNEKYNLTDFGLDKVYKGVADIGSRNIVKGLYRENGFSCGELALYCTKQEGRKTMRVVAFIGKYLNLQNTLHFEGRYILTFKGEKDTDLPTDIEDLVELHNQDNFVVYGPEGSDYTKDIPNKYISALKNIKVSNHLLNLNVVLWAGHTGVYLSYDDPVVAIPFDKPFDDTPQQEFKEHLLAVLEAERIINK